MFLVLRADDVHSLISDPRTRQIETELLQARGISSGAIMDFISNSMLFANGQVHRRRRQPLAKCFAFRMMANIRPQIRAFTNELLHQHLGDGRIKLRDDYAASIPAITVAAILGIPRSDIPLFTSLVYKVSRILTTSWSVQDLPEIEAATQGLIEYCSALIDERRKFPINDFLSQYIAHVDEEGALSSVEAVMQIMSVILGGSDTTRTAIVIQTALMLERPKVWNAVRGNPNLIAASVAEALRFQPAVASIPRLALQDITFDGHTIPKGSPMLLSTMSALRDDALFPNPDQFDIGRHQPRWPSIFGGGEHRCLGEALAKIELEEALMALTSSTFTVQLEGQLSVHGHAGIRQVDELEVSFN